ncbi:MAG: hypothetical protein M3321_12945 [Actinomycetota bacterium]|nr:hypothetical protein [Actinomycetota bacterium]
MGQLLSWAALLAGVVMAAIVVLLFLPSFGGSIVLGGWPILLSIAAWFLARRDAVFWTGFAINLVLFALALVAVLGIWFG